MSKRLEHEFPVVRWQAPARPGVDQDLVRRAVARGRHLRHAAARRGLRGIVASASRAVGSFVRYGAYGIAKRPPEPGCGA